MNSQSIAQTYSADDDTPGTNGESPGGGGGRAITDDTRLLAGALANFALPDWDAPDTQAPIHCDVCGGVLPGAPLCDDYWCSCSPALPVVPPTIDDSTSTPCPSDSLGTPTTRDGEVAAPTHTCEQCLEAKPLCDFETFLQALPDSPVICDACLDTLPVDLLLALRDNPPELTPEMLAAVDRSRERALDEAVARMATPAGHCANLADCNTNSCPTCDPDIPIFARAPEHDLTGVLPADAWRHDGHVFWVIPGAEPISCPRCEGMQSEDSARRAAQRDVLARFWIVRYHDDPAAALALRSRYGMGHRASVDAALAGYLECEAGDIAWLWEATERRVAAQA